jgi:hypothetical protein
MMRRLTQREVCKPGDYALETFGLMFATFIAGVAWHTLSHPNLDISHQRASMNLRHVTWRSPNVRRL